MFAAMNYTPWFALGEFVDNAITSAKLNEDRLVRSDPEYHLEIDIRFDEGAGTIEISDNAAGISREDLPRALRTASPPADLRFLSIYGVGMKAAGLWWASTLTIETKALGERVRRTVTIDTKTLDTPGGGSILVKERPASTHEHGTVIRLSNLTKKAPEGRTLGKVREYLSSMYRNFILDGGNTTIRVKGEDLSFTYPDILKAPIWPSTAGPTPGARPLVWEMTIDVTLSTGERVTGWVGLLAKGSTAGAGFLLTFHEKAVVGVGAGTAVGDEFYRPKEIFGGSNSYRRQRLVGEFDVSDFGKSITSDSVNWEAEQEEEFLALLRKKLTSKRKNFLEQAENFRTRERGGSVPTTQGAATQAVAALAQTAKSSGGLLSGPSAPIPPPVDPVITAHKTRRMSLPVPGGTKTVVVKLTVEQAGDADWLSVYTHADELTVRVNQDHPFMLSFGQLPTQQLEPMLRLALGVGAAEFLDPENVRTRLNMLLRGPLATRSGLEPDD